MQYAASAERDAMCSECRDAMYGVQRCNVHSGEMKCLNKYLKFSSPLRGETVLTTYVTLPETAVRRAKMSHLKLIYTVSL